MKKIYFLLCCFSCFYLNGQNIPIKLTKVTINSKAKYPIKGYLFDVAEDKIMLVPQRKLIKQMLLSDSCKVCYTIPRDIIWDLKFSQTKPFRPIGTMMGAGLGIILVAAADNTPNPDGLNGKDIAGLYAAMGIVLGGATDLVRLIGHFNGKNLADINRGLPNVLLPKAAVYQFNKHRNQQLVKLPAILAQIEIDEMSHRKRIKVYTKGNKLQEGYIIGQRDNALVLGLDKRKIISDRRNLPTPFNSIPFQDIFYYEFRKW